MAAVLPERAMARQLLHPFFTSRNREDATAEGPTENHSEPQRSQHPPSVQRQPVQIETVSDDASATDLEEDLNQERRKRRRTASLAGQEPDVQHTSVRGLETESVSIMNASHETEVGARDQPLVKDDRRGVIELPQLDGAVDSPKFQTPPKNRVLKLRSDGKLKSPGFTDTSEELEPRKRRKRRGGGKRDKHLILRYGRTPHERLAVGRKIEQINGGKLRVRPLPIVDVEATLSEAEGKKPGGEGGVEPKRGPTHPFFLGRRKQQDSISGDPSKPSKNQEEGTASNEDGKSGPVSKSKASSWPAAFGASFSKPPKIPGSLPAIWPPKGMQHVRDSPSIREVDQIVPSQPVEVNTQKLKGKERPVLAAENVFTIQEKLVTTYKERLTSGNDPLKSKAQVYAPTRLLITGQDLQIRLMQNLSALSTRDVTASYLASTNGFPASQKFLSEAAENLYNRVASSFCAFDSFDYEAQDWSRKYAPRAVNQILQAQSDLSLLRNWIHAMNVDSVDVKAQGKGEKMNAKRQLAEKRRKRKLKGELDDFIVSSDEEAGDLVRASETEGEMHTGSADGIDAKDCKLKRLRPGNLHKTRAVLISGPHGCGKTASVYAIASELGFEVFEINSGTRRNGRDIMDRVGDMTRNHLVQQDKLSGVVGASQTNEAIESVDEKQQSVASFFTSKPKTTGQKGREKPAAKSAESGQEAKARKQQKQSLILLEEVDILFDEDRPFWSAVFTLIVQSRRPVVMTCSDEHSLPLEDFVDTSILRLTAQPPGTIAEYLMCLAANEGHLLSVEPVRDLVALRDNDLRGSLADLQFWCQMAVGDEKHGTTWFTEVASANKRRDASQAKLRVVSEATCREDFSLLERKQGRDRDLAYGSRLMRELYDIDNLDLAELNHFSSLHAKRSRSQDENCQALMTLDLLCDAQSASDTWLFSPNSGDILDPSQPELSSTQRLDYVDNYALLQTDPLEQPSDLGSNLAFTTRAACQRLLMPLEDSSQCFKRKTLISMLLEKKRNEPVHPSRVQFLMRQTLESLTEPQEGTPWNPSKGPGMSVFYGPGGTIAADIAPFVREVALYDLELEEERRRLSSLMDMPGRKGKRQRKTRASRAALEGGSKASTRRERWWADGVDYKDILRTAGIGWTQLALHAYESSKLQSLEPDTRESSMAPSSSSGIFEERMDSADEIAR